MIEAYRSPAMVGELAHAATRSERPRAPSATLSAESTRAKRQLGLREEASRATSRDTRSRAAEHEVRTELLESDDSAWPMNTLNRMHGLSIEDK